MILIRQCGLLIRSMASRSDSLLPLHHIATIITSLPPVPALLRLSYASVRTRVRTTGTTNFVTGQNDVVVSIGCWVAGVAQVGVIFNPFHNECFTATAGGGAYCNGKVIHVSEECDLSKVVVMNNIGPSRDVRFVATSTRQLEKVLTAGVRGLRCGGSCAMNMCRQCPSPLSTARAPPSQAPPITTTVRCDVFTRVLVPGGEFGNPYRLCSFKSNGTLL